MCRWYYWSMNREPFVVGEYYHIYNRGVDKRVTFMNDMDYERFKLMLYLANSVKQIAPSKLLQNGSDFYELWNVDREDTVTSIGAWCLMPNHFHLLLKEAEEGGISKFMHKLGTGYTAFFNSINQRTGALFQGRFKSRRVDSDAYMQYLYCYIHMNPLKILNPEWRNEINKGKFSVDWSNYLENFEHSSLRDLSHKKLRNELRILSTEDFPEYFSRKGHLEEIKEWLTYNST